MTYEEGEPDVDIELADWSTAQDVIDALVIELRDWAFTREKVLDKLDLKGARRARAIIRDLETLAVEFDRLEVAGATISADEDLAPLHALLDQIDDLLERDRSRSEGRVESVPPPVSEIRETTPMPPVKLEAAPVCFEDFEDDENERTRSGLPSQVMEQYLREVKEG